MKSFQKLLGMGLLVIFTLIPLINLGNALVSTQFNYHYEQGDVVIFRFSDKIIRDSMTYDEIANDGSYINVSSPIRKTYFTYRQFENFTKIDTNHLNMTISHYTNITSNPNYLDLNGGDWALEEANRTHQLTNDNNTNLMKNTLLLPNDVFLNSNGLGMNDSINSTIRNKMNISNYDTISILDEVLDLTILNSSINTIVLSTNITRNHSIVSSTLTFAGNVTHNDQTFNASVILTASIQSNLSFSHLLNEMIMTFTLNQTLSNSSVGNVLVTGFDEGIKYVLVYDSTGLGFQAIPPETTTDTDTETNDGETIPFIMPLWGWITIAIAGGLVVIITFYYNSSSYQAKCVESQLFCRSKKTTKPTI